MISPRGVLSLLTSPHLPPPRAAGRPRPHPVLHHRAGSVIPHPLHDFLRGRPTSLHDYSWLLRGCAASPLCPAGRGSVHSAPPGGSPRRCSRLSCLGHAFEENPGRYRRQRHGDTCQSSVGYLERACVPTSYGRASGSHSWSGRRSRSWSGRPSRTFGRSRPPPAVHRPAVMPETFTTTPSVSAATPPRRCVLLAADCCIPLRQAASPHSYWRGRQLPSVRDGVVCRRWEEVYNWAHVCGAMS